MADNPLETIKKVVDAIDSVLGEDDKKKDDKKDQKKDDKKDEKKDQKKDVKKDEKKEEKKDDKKGSQGSKTGTQSGSKKSDEKNTEKSEDKITYQKMIPAFRFEVSFLKEEKKEEKKDPSLFEKVVNIVDKILPGDQSLKKDNEKGKDKEKSNESEAASIPFSEASGLSLEIQTEDITEGGGNDYVIRLPKPPKARNLVLKRALSATPPDIVEWARKAVEEFVFEPRTLVLSIINYEGKPVKTWNFKNAYPVKLSLSDLSSTKNEIVIETLEIAYKKVTLVKPS